MVRRTRRRVIDRAIEYMSPVRAARRMQARAALDQARAITDTGYSEGGASRTKTSLKSWRWRSDSPQSDIDANLVTLRERSRSLYYTAPVATSAIERNLVHTVGQGLRCSPRPAWQMLGIAREEADSIARRTKFLFDAWARDKRVDVTGQNNFYELQQTTLMTWMLDGEAFVLPQYGTGPLALRVVEGDLCVNPGTFGEAVATWVDNPDTGNRIANGVEVDDAGTAVAYWFISRYRDDWSAPAEWVRIPAVGDETGNPNVLHVFHAVRPTQYRGVPYLAPVIDSIKQLTRYTDAEIMAAVINGMFAVFISSEDSEPNLGADVPGSMPAEPGLSAEPDDDELFVGNGNIGYLRPGESVNVVDAKRPNSNFDGFVTAMSRQIGAALNIPSELLLMQFTSSYSASRGALLEAWNYFDTSREWFAADFCQPVYELWLADAVSRGLVDMPGFFADAMVRAAWSQATWTGPAPGQLNPTVEVQAAVAKVQAGLSTGEREAMAMNGSDYRENLEQLAGERDARRELGLEEEEAGADAESKR